jgi:tetratricopeptide (TPR) repeat protein
LSNPRISYHLASAYDRKGEESKAIPLYKNAIKGGLKDKDLEGAIIGLGSSYRVIGQYKKSIETLRQAKRKFPKNRAIDIFLALDYFNVGKPSKALALLLKSLAETTKDQSIKKYKRALLFYAHQLK